MFPIFNTTTFYLANYLSEHLKRRKYFYFYILIWVISGNFTTLGKFKFLSEYDRDIKIFLFMFVFQQFKYEMSRISGVYVFCRVSIIVGVLWDSWICDLTLYYLGEIIGLYPLKYFFFLILFSLWKSSFISVRPLDVNPQLLDALFCFV